MDGSGDAPAGVRVLALLLTIVAGLVTVALMWSDRAPGVLRAVFGDAARRLWARVDPERRAAISSNELAQPDLVVHVAVWSVVAALVGVTVWWWRRALGAGLVLAGVSVFVEFGQTRWASTRAFEASDVVANLVGVALGTSASIALVVVWMTIAGAFRRRRIDPYTLHHRGSGEA
ncbi:MAG: hypothetical protein AAGG08_05900 [Actinomycetota bacterium]